jgi:8-oxo-dGTP diphosphatase
MPGSIARKLPSVTVDVVLVANLEGLRKVLLVRRRKPPFEGLWAIPGGFVEPDEPLEAAAHRELREETGAEPVLLEQLHTFGDPGRDPRGWTISVTYLARLSDTEARTLKPEAGSDATAVHWFDLHDPPPLAFDHAEILACAACYLADTDSIQRVTSRPNIISRGVEPLPGAMEGTI